VYRFLATPRWLGLAALMLAMAAVMVGLGRWQLSRYELRAGINERIDAAATAEPAPLTEVLPAPQVGGGAAPPAEAAWRRISASGVYDASNEILVRSRTVDGRVGFEIVTPLRLADGSAVLVDRGWVAPGRHGAASRPDTPPVPTGTVTVVGRLHPTESGARTVERAPDGVLEVRRIGVPEIGRQLSYPLYGAYLLADPVETGFTAVPVGHESAWQNAGYVVQWWLFAALTLVGFGYLARREAHGPRGGVAAPELGYGPLHDRADAGDRTDR
jgi:cytochrome oxidase assembly protein ShyY1